MTRTELIIQLLKVAIGLAFGAYFVWWSLEVLDRLAPEDEVPAAVTKHGYEPSREAAMAAFAKSWRREYARAALGEAAGALSERYALYGFPGASRTAGRGSNL
jgi:hypothetical protein